MNLYFTHIYDPATNLYFIHDGAVVWGVRDAEADAVAMVAQLEAVYWAMNVAALRDHLQVEASGPHAALLRYVVSLDGQSVAPPSPPAPARWQGGPIRNEVSPYSDPNFI